MFFFQWEPTSPDILIYRKYDKYRVRNRYENGCSVTRPHKSAVHLRHISDITPFNKLNYSKIEITILINKPIINSIVNKVKK